MCITQLGKSIENINEIYLIDKARKIKIKNEKNNNIQKYEIRNYNNKLNY